MGHSTHTQALTFAGAQVVLAACITKATEMNIPACIAVTDAAGHPIVTARMDGAPFMAAEIAANKARTVAGFNGFPTGAWWPSIKEDGSLAHGITHTPGLIVFAGGVPVERQGVLLGAVGVSGGEPSEDEQIAETGAGVFQNQAPLSEWSEDR